MNDINRDEAFSETSKAKDKIHEKIIELRAYGGNILLFER